MGRMLFVTGTDTGVGKTVVAAWLASAAPPDDRVCLIKAVQTGADPAVDGDEAFYRAALRSRPVRTATLVTLPEPLAPSIAARRAGTSIETEAIVGPCRRLSADHDLTIVEGSGGLLVRINSDTDFADLAGMLNAPLVVAIRPGLGTLNHTMLTVEAAHARGLHVEMLVCSGVGEGPEVVEAENLRFLSEHLSAIPIVTLRRLPEDQLTNVGLLGPRLIGVAPPFLRHVSFDEAAALRDG